MTHNRKWSDNRQDRTIAKRLLFLEEVEEDAEKKRETFDGFSI